MRRSAAHEHSHTVSERIQLQYSSTRLRGDPGLNPRCPNCLTNGALHLVPGAFAREQLPESATFVLECFRVAPIVSACTIAPDSQGLVLCDALFEGPVSPPVSEDQPERSRDDGSGTLTRRTTIGECACPLAGGRELVP